MIASAKYSTRPYLADPLLKMIEDYRKGCAAFEELPEPADEEEHGRFVAETYGPPYDALESWCQPAVTYAGAVEALGLALEDARNHSSRGLTASMISASLGFFDRKQGAGKSCQRTQNDDLQDLIGKAKALLKLSDFAATDMPPIDNAEVVEKLSAIRTAGDVCIAFLEQAQEICDGIEFSERVG